ncbi:MAG TPA: ABC transporter substrate-binding protein [Chloroflexota bacterium]|nr:ABC transporter substrate-binding protein [Chloroflexota bacterium]
MPTVRCRAAASAFVALLALTGCAAPAPSTPAGGPAAAGPTAGAVVPTAPPQPVTLRQAAQTGASGVVVWLAEQRGYFQQEGITVEQVPFTNASETIPALATGQVEISPMPANPAMWNAVARGVPAKIMVDVGTYTADRGDQVLAVRKAVYDSGRGRRLEDLPSLSLAITPPGKATTTACALSVGLQRVGLTLDDLNIQPITFPDMVGAFANGAIDAGMILEPFLTRAVQQGSAVKVMGIGDIYPNFTIASLGFAESLYDNRPTAKGFVRAYIRGIRDYLAGVGSPSGSAAREEIDTLVARNTSIDLDTVRAMIPPYFNPNGLPNRESMLYCYGFFRDQGLIPQPVSDTTMQTIWGTDLINEVLDEIGRVADS